MKKISVPALFVDRGSIRYSVSSTTLGIALLISQQAEAQSTIAVPPAATNGASVAGGTALGGDGSGLGEITTSEITVTARRRTERLVDVPDAVTAISTATIEQANITSIESIATLVPNLSLRNDESFGSSGFKMSMRGIANGQNGWPSVAFLVDGVPIDSVENLAGTNLEDLQQIEVLRGPQSAVYGANAIAGAINITTRAPTDALEGRVQVEYANGNDKKAIISIGGPLVKDLIHFRSEASWRNSDGLMDSASNGLHLARRDVITTRNQLEIKPSDRATISLVADYSHWKKGAVYQPKIPSAADFDINADDKSRRRLAGIEKRDYQKYSAKLHYEFDGAELISVSAYSHAHQHLESSLCYDDPDNPAVDNGAAPGVQTLCVAGIQALGSAALPGQVVDQGYVQNQLFKTFYHDTRIQSAGIGRFKWMVGGSYMWRKSEDGFNLGNILAGPSGGASCAAGYGLNLAGCGAYAIFYPRWDRRQDYWWGVYGQLSYSLTDTIEITGAGRYDHQRYVDTQFASEQFATIIPVTRPDGTVGNTLENKKNSFQPKAQISYKPRPGLNLYASWSKGFRAGYYNYGQFVSPENTTNYEAGIKTLSQSPLGRLTITAAAFHIDYSNQQFTTAIPTPPFILATVIPKTRINGAEFEANLIPLRGVTINASIGYLDATIANGHRSPYAPKLTSSLSVTMEHPLTDSLTLVGYGNWSRHSRQHLTSAAPDFVVPAKSFVDLRIGLRYNSLELAGFVENLTNEREALQAPVEFGTAAINPVNLPRRYGVTGKFKF